MGLFYSTQANCTDLCLECGVDEVSDQCSSSRVCFGCSLDEDLPATLLLALLRALQTQAVPRRGARWERPGESMKGRLPLRVLYKCTFVLFLRFYLFIHERHRERQRHRPREKQAPSREPDMGLDPGTLGSRPRLKAGTKPLSHPSCPKSVLYK